jgi:hypothetical protein
MKPSIDALRQHYPKSELREVLYARIGWSDVVSHPAFQDTCAIRMSVGLIGAGVPLPGASMKVTAGPAYERRRCTAALRFSAHTTVLSPVFNVDRIRQVRSSGPAMGKPTRTSSSDRRHNLLCRPR